MTFANHYEVKDTVRKYATNTQKNVKCIKSCKTKVKYACEKVCKWTIYARKDKYTKGFTIKTYQGKYDCNPDCKNRQITARFLANFFKPRFLENPNYKLADIKVDVEQRLKGNANYIMCKREKKMVMDELFGKADRESQILETYCDELEKSDPGSYIKNQISKDALRKGRRGSKRVFLCLNALKTNWKWHCKPIMELTGCLMKKRQEGQFLSTVGLDCMNRFFPVA